MKVSLVTVCRNAAATLGRTMASAFAQRDVELEYLVIDGASTDGTRELIERTAAEHPALIWRSEPDQGLYDALNKGIALATGDIVGILNADDVFEDEHTLAAIVAAFKPETEALYADIRFVRNGHTVRYYSAAHWRPWMHHWGYMPPHPSLYLRRELFQRLGGYQLGYRISADFELMVRYLCRQRVKSAYLPRCVVQMTPGGLSTAGWRATIWLNAENVRANRANGYFSCFAMMLPKYLFKIWGFVFR